MKWFIAVLLYLVVYFIQRSRAASNLALLTRQVMLQQLYIDERVRSEGDSGIKIIRNNRIGPKNYYADSAASFTFAAAHNHANNMNTIGMGEVTAVLNGVDFRTRHNDYKLRMKHRTSPGYDYTEAIPYPDVPPEVLSKTSVPDQVEEMREWFKAFKDQNYAVRDYRKYFKPVLCYMEGGWTAAKDAIDESFESDRHSIEANSWLDLQEKIRFTSYSGSKNINENFAYLPTTIMDIVNDTAIFAQWNYFIACHPLEEDLPLNRLRLADDLKTQVAYDKDYEELALERSARFIVNPEDYDEFLERPSHHGLLDKLMEQIPGKDNYKADIVDDAMGTAYHFHADPTKDKPLNAGYYHRAYKTLGKDAMGRSMKRRGYNDANIFMAATTNKKIAPIKTQFCSGPRNSQVCVPIEQRWTYAIPLEIIYMTPLSKWNPYNLTYQGDNRNGGKLAEAGGRRGDINNPDKAFNGTNWRRFYQTPMELFKGGVKSESDAADTSGGVTGVLSPDGTTIHQTMASGHYIVLPEIPGVGRVRQRYPIAPIHGEGSSVWKELNALKDVLLERIKYSKHYKQAHGGGEGEPTKLYRYKMSTSNRDDIIVKHTHSMELDEKEMELLRNGTDITKTTTTDNGHNHQLVLESYQHNEKWKYRYIECDGQKQCYDKHGRGIWMPRQ